MVNRLLIRWVAQSDIWSLVLWTFSLNNPLLSDKRHHHMLPLNKKNSGLILRKIVNTHETGLTYDQSDRTIPTVSSKKRL